MNGNLEEALAQIKELPGDYVREKLTYPVVEIAVAFAEKGFLKRALSVGST